jgi:hypothetical protein
MDFGLIGGVNPPDPKAGGPMSFETFEPARFAMGDTVRYAERVGLLDMKPRPDLSSTRFTLANPGVEYLTLQPELGAFTVTVEPGRYTVEWFGVDGRNTIEGKDVAVDVEGPVELQSPLDTEPSVLYLRSV